MNNSHAKTQNILESVMIPLKLKALSLNIPKNKSIEHIKIHNKQIYSQRSFAPRISFNKQNSNTTKSQIMGDKYPKCRICLEEENDQFQLISPCKCEGSIKYLHSICLKKWLNSCKQSPFDSKCEICQTQYNIGLVKKLQFNKEKCKVFFKKKSYLIILIFLALIGCSICVDIFSIKPSESKHKGIILSVLYSLSVLIYLLYLAKLQTDFKKQCYDNVVQDWQILDMSLDGKLAVLKSITHYHQTQLKISINNYVKEFSNNQTYNSTQNPHQTQTNI